MSAELTAFPRALLFDQARTESIVDVAQVALEPALPRQEFARLARLAHRALWSWVSAVAAALRKPFETAVGAAPWADSLVVVVAPEHLAKRLD
jgi:hypothetical protein